MDRVETFPTKIDSWVAVLLIGAIATVGYKVAQRLDVATNTSQVAVALLPFGALAIVALLTVPTRYELHSEELIVRSGLLRYRVPYVKICSVMPSSNPLAAPALSMDRLKIQKEQGGYLLISPNNKKGFLAALQARASHLKLLDGKLVPRSSSQRM